MWFWKQSTGTLRHNGQIVHTGYSGLGEGKNNPAMEAVQGVGPIPAGRWKMTGLRETTDTHGPAVITLTPDPTTDTHGRSAFLIHGESASHPGEASRGCIIIGGRANRLAIWNSGDHELTVTS